MPSIKEEYLSVAAPASAEFIERKSRFIGSASGASSEEEAMAFVARIRAAHSDATHNCYAYVVGLSGQYQKASDDGEPGGTAGRPILAVVLRQGLVNVVVVVTRYFGGILLGTGGLVRAYTQGAKLALDAAGVARTVRCNRVLMSVDYPLYGRVTRELENRLIPIEETSFGVDVSVLVRMMVRDVEPWNQWIQDASAGTAECAVVDELYAPVGDDGALL